MVSPNENCQEWSTNTNFEEIFHQSPIGIFLYDKNGVLTNANVSALSIARIPKLDDVLGTNLFDNPKIAIKKEEILKKKLIKFQDTLNLIKISEQNIYNPTESKIIDIDWTVSMIDSGYMVQIQDITEHKKVEKDKKSLLNEVQNERDMLSALINNIPDEIWFADNNKKFTLANPSALQEFGLYSNNINVEEMASNLEVYRLDGSPRPVEEAPPLRALKGEIIKNLEEIIRTPSRKELRYRQVNASPVKDKNDNIIGSISVVRDITEQKTAENELKESEERFRSIIENIQDAYMRADKEGTIIMASPSAARMYRFNSTQEMIGTSTPSYFKNSEDRDFAIEELKKHGNFNDYEVEGRRNDGTFFWVSQNAQYYYDNNGKILGSETIVRDITELKKAEEALVVSEKRYRELFNSMTEMFQVIELIYDTKGKPIDYFYRDVNPAFCGLVGKTREDLIDKRVKKIFGIVEDYWLEKYEEVAKTGNPIQFENYGAELDKWYEVNVWKVGENQVAIIFTDTTERKHREEREKKFIDELTRSNTELERFAYVSSHDLQEPLRMVTLYSQLLEKRYKDSLDADADDFIEYIVDNAKRMKYLIDDLLEYSRVTNKTREFENVDFEKLLDVALANLSILIVENNVKVTHEPLPTVFAEQNQMLQVFQNLITNAIKFRREKSPEINISTQKGQKEWIFGVSDNGIGIKPEHQKQIFDVFKRLHTRDEYPGTGIGLSICQKIIKHHGGRIWVESELGKGSTFYFTIPIK